MLPAGPPVSIFIVFSSSDLSFAFLRALSFAFMALCGLWFVFLELWVLLWELTICFDSFKFYLESFWFCFESSEFCFGGFEFCFESFGFCFQLCFESLCHDSSLGCFLRLLLSICIEQTCTTMKKYEIQKYKKAKIQKEKKKKSRNTLADLRHNSSFWCFVTSLCLHQPLACNAFKDTSEKTQ